MSSPGKQASLLSYFDDTDIVLPTMWWSPWDLLTVMAAGSAGWHCKVCISLNADYSAHHRLFADGRRPLCSMDFDEDGLLNPDINWGSPELSLEVLR